MRHESVSEAAEIGLFKIIDQIREEPRRIRMEVFGSILDTEEIDADDYEQALSLQDGEGEAIYEGAIDDSFDLHPVPPCGTIGCIAGWVYLNAHPELVSRAKAKFTESESLQGSGYLSEEEDLRYNNTYISLPTSTDHEAQKILELSDDQRMALFYLPGWGSAFPSPKRWPKEFADAYLGTNDYKKKAEVVIDRIKHFIATGE